MIFVNTAFMDRLQREDVGNIVELISLEGRGFKNYYTSANQEIYATLSGALTEYKPLPGQAAGTIQSATDLTVATMEFVLASSAANDLITLINANQIDAADLTVERVFADTPDLGRMPVYRGKLGDISWNRTAVKGQARNVWDSFDTNWPYHTYSDGCIWRFGSAGCGFDTSSVTLTVTASAWIVGSSSRIGIYTTSLGSRPDDYFTFGRITWVAGVNSGQVRAIRNHLGNAILLSHALPFQPRTGDSFTIFPGCRKRRIEDCTSKYNNAENFSGFWTTPIPEEIYVGE